MTNNKRVKAILNYENYDRLPMVHFGFWTETLEKWAEQGHISKADAKNWSDGNSADKAIGYKLGFDFNWNNVFAPAISLRPEFETKVIKQFDDGSQHILNGEGCIVLQKPGAISIPAEIDHILKDRRSWEEHYLSKLQFTEDRILKAMVNTGSEFVAFDEGGLEFLQNIERESPLGIYVGSLFGVIRNWFGVVGISYLLMDDEKLYDHVIDTVGNLCYKCTEFVLSKGAKFDYGHFWEDICYKNGPLVTPSVFDAKVGPHYKKITELLNGRGIDIVSLDCDGMIDALIPTWFKNGVNTMFPIEVGTWGASIAPWREKFGKELRGVGGMNKTVFARDYAAINGEVERLKPLIGLGGYIPCPDHRIAPDAKWENVQYYCEKMRKSFC